jgi:hypothetical protein
MSCGILFNAVQIADGGQPEQVLHEKNSRILTCLGD